MPAEAVGPGKQKGFDKPPRTSSQQVTRDQKSNMQAEAFVFKCQRKQHGHESIVFSFNCIIIGRWSLPRQSSSADHVQFTARSGVTFIYLLKSYSLINRTGSPQGFSLNGILQKLNTIQKMHILQTQNIKQNPKVSPLGVALIKKWQVKIEVAGTSDRFSLAFQYQIKYIIKIEWTKTITT